MPPKNDIKSRSQMLLMLKPAWKCLKKIFLNFQILNEKLDKRFNELVTVLNQPKEDILIQVTAVKPDMKLRAW